MFMYKLQVSKNFQLAKSETRTVLS